MADDLGAILHRIDKRMELLGLSDRAASMASGLSSGFIRSFFRIFLLTRVKTRTRLRSRPEEGWTECPYQAKPRLCAGIMNLPD